MLVKLYVSASKAFLKLLLSSSNISFDKSIVNVSSFINTSLIFVSLGKIALNPLGTKLSYFPPFINNSVSLIAIPLSLVLLSFTLHLATKPSLSIK